MTIVHACKYAYPDQIEAGNIVFAQPLDEAIKISHWSVAGIPQPTDEELNNLIVQYQDQFELDSIKTEAKIAIMNHLDKVAQEKEYSSALSCSSYFNSTVTQWKNEALAFIEWRDSVFNYAYEQFNLIESKQRSIPTVDEFIQELPVISWP